MSEYKKIRQTQRFPNNNHLLVLWVRPLNTKLKRNPISIQFNAVPKYPTAISYLIKLTVVVQPFFKPLFECLFVFVVGVGCVSMCYKQFSNMESSNRFGLCYLPK